MYQATLSSYSSIFIKVLFINYNNFFLISKTRPKSTNVVTIDTDVTITGVYVNQSVTSQETYCKMLQYRTAYSVTEERVVRPPGQDPPKSYTPLSALSNMKPPENAEKCKSYLYIIKISIHLFVIVLMK
jgi:hypothetical protein